MKMTYHLADHYGELCICSRSVDCDKPEVWSAYYPTPVRTRDFLGCMFDRSEFADDSRWPELLAEFGVRVGQFSGEYFADAPKRSYYVGGSTCLRLTNAGATLPVHSFATPAPRPKTRLPVKWRNGQWFKETRRGWAPV